MYYYYVIEQKVIINDHNQSQHSNVGSILKHTEKECVFRSNNRTHRLELF